MGRALRLEHLVQVDQRLSLHSPTLPLHDQICTVHWPEVHIISLFNPALPPLVAMLRGLAA